MNTYLIISLALPGLVLLKQFSPAIRRTLPMRKKEDAIDCIDIINYHHHYPNLIRVKKSVSSALHGTLTLLRQIHNNLLVS